LSFQKIATFTVHPSDTSICPSKNLNGYIVLITNIKLKRLHRSRSGLKKKDGWLFKNKIF
jgi:hypothetical protein